MTVTASPYYHWPSMVSLDHEQWSYFGKQIQASRTISLNSLINWEHAGACYALSSMMLEVKQISCSKSLLPHVSPSSTVCIFSCHVSFVGYQSESDPDLGVWLLGRSLELSCLSLPNQSFTPAVFSCSWSISYTTPIPIPLLCVSSLT